MKSTPCGAGTTPQQEPETIGDNKEMSDNLLDGEPQKVTADYSAYLKTDAAKSPLHGFFAVWPLLLPKDDHTTGKRPCDIDGNVNAGVYGFTRTADEVMKVLYSQPKREIVISAVRRALVRTAEKQARTEEGKKEAEYLKSVEITLCLGRTFSVDDGIMTLDFDGHHPAASVSNGTGYREVSSSGTGDHILFRVPKELFPAEVENSKSNKIKRNINGCDIELFYGTGAGIALTAREASADNLIDLDLNSEAGKTVLSLISQQQQRGGAGKRANPTTSRTTTAPTKEEVDAVVEKHRELYTFIIKEVRDWQPKEGLMKDTDDASVRLMSVCDLIVGRLRCGGFPVARDGITLAVCERIVKRSSVWMEFYAAGKGHESSTSKLEITILKAIEYTEPAFPVESSFTGEEENDEPEDDYDYEVENAKIQSLMSSAPGPLVSAVKYYNAISPVPQPLFALSASLIAAGAVLARNWQTRALNFNNAPIPPNTLNDYNIFIAPTGTGKDTIKNFLADTIDNEYIRQPSGASGRTALHKMLQMYPRSIALWDEAGKRLAEGGRDPSGIKQGAETLGMEIYGRTGYIEPQEYAENKDSPLLKRIKRHGLVVVRTTTPETFTAAVPQSAVNDGWLPRHNVIVSVRKRPSTLGGYNENPPIEDPKKLLLTWNSWRDAHIGMPEADTYKQAVNPITACIWNYSIPDEVAAAAEQMRDRSGKYSTNLNVVDDDPITIEWEKDAADEIGRIYAENEAVPVDLYTCMRHRKLPHIIKIAGIIAVLRDGVTLPGMKEIYRSHTESKKDRKGIDGKKLLEEEKRTKTALKYAKDNYDAAQKPTGRNNPEETKKRQTDAYTAYVKAQGEYNKAHSQAEAKVRMVIRSAVEENFKARITKDDVKWAYDYINLIEILARKLVVDELADIGFNAALEGLVAYLEKHGGSAAESRIVAKCSPIRKLDQKLRLADFWRYVEDSGCAGKQRTGKTGRRWYLITQSQATEREEVKKQAVTLKEQPIITSEEGVRRERRQLMKQSLLLPYP